MIQYNGDDPISVEELLDSFEVDNGEGTLCFVDLWGNPLPDEINGEPAYMYEWAFLRATTADGTAYIDYPITQELP